jgi:hypothetical protein
MIDRHKNQLTFKYHHVSLIFWCKYFLKVYFFLEIIYIYIYIYIWRNLELKRVLLFDNLIYVSYSTYIEIIRHIKKLK